MLNFCPYIQQEYIWIKQKTCNRITKKFNNIIIIVIVEDDISAVSIAPSHFRRVLARTKTTAPPRARVRALLMADPDVLGSLAL